MTEELSLNEATPASPAVVESATTEPAIAPSIAPTDFISSLPEDLRADPSFTDIKDLGGLAKSYVSAQHMLGKSVRIPGEDAGKEDKDAFYERLASVDGVMRKPNPEDPEAMNAFYAALGRPETADAYDLGLPEGMDINDEVQAEFKVLAHSLGLNNQQVQALAQYEAKQVESYQEHFNESREKATEVLKEHWGHEFHNRLEGAKSVAKVYGEKYPEAMKEIMSSNMSNNPAIIAMMSELGRSLQETGHAGATGASSYGVSSDEARNQIAEVYSNKAHPYWDANSSDHAAAVEKVHKLNGIAYPEPGSS